MREAVKPLFPPPKAHRATRPERRFRLVSPSGVGALNCLVPHKYHPCKLKGRVSNSAPERGFRNAYEDLSCKRGFVVYPGKERYPIKKNVLALPVTDLRRIIEEQGAHSFPFLPLAAEH